MQLSKTLLVITVLILIYVIFLFFSDVEKTFSILSSIDKKYLMGGICLWLFGSSLRVLRWHFFLRNITKKISFIRSALYFLSGFAFIFSPARVGEMLRSPLIKRDHNIPISKTAPIVLIERFYDLISITIIIAIGLMFTNIEKTVILIPVGFIIVTSVIIKNKNIINKLFYKLSKIKILNKIIPDLDDSFEITYSLLRSKYFVVGLSISLGIGLLQVVAVYLFVEGLSSHIDFQDLAVIFHAASFAAAITMIPAGIGIFEGGLVGLLVLYNIEYEIAFAITVLVRIVSTGILTIIGLVALRLISRR